jgi:hypothetical protein
MHRYGTLDIQAKAAAAPVLTAMAREPWTLKGVHILDCRTEIDAKAGDALIPPSLRPGIPSYGALVVSRVEDSAAGPFAIAELRVGVRIGSTAGFFLVGAVCDSAAARQALAERWGYPSAAGEIALDELYHKVSARVTVAGRTVLELSLSDRRPLPGTRLNVPSIVNLARQGPGGPLRLFNTPVQSAYAQADGGRYVIGAFDGAAFGADEAFRPSFPMGSTIGLAEIVLGAVDVTADPVRPAEESLEIVG